MSLEAFFEPIVAALPVSTTAKAYVEGLYLDQAKGKRVVDLSRQSLVLSYQQAKATHDLEAAQALGDWVTWVLSWTPAHVADVRELAESIGRASYWRCYRLVPSWRVFEELSDVLPSMTRRVNLLRRLG